MKKILKISVVVYIGFLAINFLILIALSLVTEGKALPMPWAIYFFITTILPLPLMGLTGIAAYHKDIIKSIKTYISE